MGGGGAMRVGRVVGYNVIRGPTSFPSSTGNSAAGLGRKASRTKETIVSSTLTEDGKTEEAVASENGEVQVDDDQSVQRPCWELDDWEFAGADGDGEDMSLDSVDRSLHRVVFAGAPSFEKAKAATDIADTPSFEEAKAATDDLKDALEKIYDSSDDTGSLDKSTAKEFDLPLDITPEYSETKACVTSKSDMIRPPASKPVLQAFSLLKESIQAQNVVASLASDKNVWDAVMRNEKVMEFLKFQQTDVYVKEYDNFSKNADNFDDGKHVEDDGFIEQLMQKVKVTVSNMMGKIQALVDNIFGTAARHTSTMDKTLGASFMALAVLTIMVVMQKRS